MNLFEYGRILIRRGWMVALAVIITAGAAFAYSKTQTPIYRASQKVLVQPSRNDLGLAETLRIVLRSYVEFLYTDIQAKKVIENLQLDMTPGDLRSDVTINSDPTTLTIQIDVDLENPDMAAQVATAWGQLLVDWRNQQNSDLRREDRIEATMLDSPQPGQYRPNTRVNVIAGAVLGGLIGGVTVFVMEYLASNILKSREELEYLIAIPVLAVIPEGRGE